MQSSLPFPIPPRSTPSAFSPTGGEEMLSLLIPLGLPLPFRSSESLGPAVSGRELSLPGSLRHEILSKSLSIVKRVPRFVLQQSWEWKSAKSNRNRMTASIRYVRAEMCVEMVEVYASELRMEGG